MSLLPPPVRATARVGAAGQSAAAGSPPPARVAAGTAATGPVAAPNRPLAARRATGRFGGIATAGAVGLPRLLALELVAVAVAAAFAGGTALLWLPVAALLLALTATRIRGRWLTTDLALWPAYRRRGATVAAVTGGTGGGAAMARLRHLAPDLRIEEFPAGTARGAVTPPAAGAAVARDSAGWFAVVAVDTPAGLRDDGVILPLDRLVRTVADADVPGALVQVVTHTVPAPAFDLEPGAACAVSYRELQAGHGPAPLDRQHWIAVRVDAVELARACLGGTDESARAPEAVALLVRGIGRTLDAAGVRHRVLDADGLAGALSYSLDLGPAGPGAAGPPVESWRMWRSGTVAHACFWVRRWSRPEWTSALIEALAGTPASFSSVSLTLYPVPDGVDVRCVVRVAAPVPQLPDACAALVGAAGRFGARLLRLDGEQAPAAYATAPTGGGAW